jgi:tyrosyl-tRNA synthetase
MVDNYDWFRDMKYLDFLREVGKAFSMTQLLDRQFVQNRIGEGGSGISYAEFSYTLIQGYDFLHLYREYGVSLQLCGADQYGNCTSGIHLIKRLEDAKADVWSTPLVIDPVTGRKFGKSEGNAVWLASSDNGSGNYTSLFDFYQFWLNQSDEDSERFIKLFTLIPLDEINGMIEQHRENPSKRMLQRVLAEYMTEMIHGEEALEGVKQATDFLFGGIDIKDVDENGWKYVKSEVVTIDLPKEQIANGISVIELATMHDKVPSKSEARKLIKSNGFSVNKVKVGEKDIVGESNLIYGKYLLLQKGKKDFCLMTVN